MTDLYVYDSTEELMSRAAGAAGREPSTETQGVVSYIEVLTAFDRLRQANRRFANIYFASHGGPGCVDFRNGQLLADNAYLLEDRREVLEEPGRVLFLGCNVAEGDVGWRFLHAVGSAFVRNGFVGGCTTAVSSSPPLFEEPRLPRWGILKIIQMRDGLETRRVEVGSPLARFVRWIRS